ncbi:MAG: PIN domain-containing protein [Candidatus Dormibacteraeota bacterium]|nr:PIN domain-containing protein [Candidatus Dormibacteraeota bacterium]
MLVSLAWPSHVHHEPALAWFGQRGSELWATTPMTEAGLVRVITNQAIVPGAVRPLEALTLLSRMRAVPGHRFLADDVEAIVGSDVDPKLLLGHRDVTDAHLLAVARSNGARLATLDRGLRRLSGSTDDVVLVPVA